MAAVLAAIAASLLLARSLADALRARDLLDATFALALVLLLAASLLLGWRTRPSLPVVGVWVGIAAAYVATLTRLALPEERTHLIEYGVLALLVDAALRERARRPARALGSPALLAVVAATLVGLVDETAQLVLPDRFFDWRDVGFDALAAVMAVGAAALVRGATARSARRAAGRPG